MDVQIVVRDEDLHGLEHARFVLNKLVDADIEVGGHGVPPLTLIVDDIDALISKVRAQKAELPARIGEYGRGHVRVLGGESGMRVLGLVSGRVHEIEPGEGGALRG